MLAGMLPVIAGMAWLSRVSPGTDYWSGVFGPMVLFGVGMGVVFVPLTTASLAGVRPAGVRRRLQHGQRDAAARRLGRPGGARRGVRHRDPGLAGAPVAGPDRRRRSARQVLAHGMSTAFALAAIFDVAAFVVIAVLLRPRRPTVPDTPAALADGTEVAATAVGD